VGSYGSWWDVPVAEGSGRPGVKAARSAYEAALERVVDHRVGVPEEEA